MSGGNCPETPRQKMIGMMYLFLTAMLALNVSGELLKAFQLVDESIQQSISTVNSKNELLYTKFAIAEQSNPAKVKSVREEADLIKAAADSLYNQIYALKVLMVKTVDSEGTVDNFVGADNQDVAPQIMITEKDGARSKELKKKIEEYKSLLLSLVDGDSTLVENINRTLSTESETPSQKGDIKRSWESQKFEHLPLSASFALMTSIMSNIRTTQADVVSHLLTKIDEGDFKFNKIESIVIPNSEYVIRGGQYTAKILLAARDTLQDPRFEIGGYMPDVVNGKALLKIPATSIGPKNWKGQIIMKGPDGKDRFYPIEHSYNVIEPNVVISATKMNVLYEALENPMEISVPGINSDQISVSMTNATYRKVGSQYIVKPNPGFAGGKAMISVSAKINDRMQSLGSMEYRIKRVPNPVAMVNNQQEGKIRKNTLLAQSGVFAEMGEDFDFDLEFDVTQFTVSTIKNGFYVSETSSNNKFTDAQRDLIKGVGIGSRVFFEDVRAVGPDKRTRKLGTLTFVID